MARISLVEQYDNKDVIQQIYLLKTATDGWEERISATEQTANNALTTAEGFDMRIDAVEDSNAELNDKVDTFDTRITTAQTTADTAIGNVDTLDRQVTARIADQEVTALDVASAGTGAYAVTAHKQNGNITSNSFNISKVVSATIGEGSANNSIYLQLNLSDGTTVRTNDTVISITGVEEDIHVTSIVLEDAPDAHTIKAIFTYNNGQSISSNTLTYDYPDIASSSMPGLVMGNDAAGGVQVDGQGRMSVVGWDTFATQDALEALEDEVGAVGQAGTIRNDISLLQAKDVSLQQGIDGVDARCDNISSTVSDHGTMLSAQATAIQENTTAIAVKQDKLVIGVNMDESPTMDSQNPVTSGGVYENMVKVINFPDLTGTELTQSSDGRYRFNNSLKYSDYPGLEGTTHTSRTLAVGSISVQIHMKDGYDPVYPTSVLVSSSPYGTNDSGESIFTYNASVQFDTEVGETIDRVLIYLSGMRLFITGDVDLTGMPARQIALVGMQYHCTYKAVGSTSSSTEDFTGTLVGGTTGYSRHFEAEWIYPSYVVPAISGEGGSIVVDTYLSASSTNPVQNKVISAALDTKASTTTTDALTQEIAGFTEALSEGLSGKQDKGDYATSTQLSDGLSTKQDKLTPGTGISIEDGVISINLANANGVSF